MHFPVYHTSPLQPSLYYPFIDSLSFFPTQHSIIYDTVMSKINRCRVIDTIHPHYRGIFYAFAFVEPPFLTFPPCVHLSLCSLCHPYTIPPSCPPPPHSYSLCVSYMYSRFTQ